MYFDENFIMAGCIYRWLKRAAAVAALLLIVGIGVAVWKLDQPRIDDRMVRPAGFEPAASRV